MWELGGTEKVVCVQPEQGQGSDIWEVGWGDYSKRQLLPGEWETVAGVEAKRVDSEA